MLKSELSPDEINQYLNNRNFIRTISAIGRYNIPDVLYPSDVKMQDSERCHSVEFKENNAA